MGSKSRIAKDIVPIIQKCIDDNKIDTYIENNKDKEFITVHDTNPAFSNTVFLKDETGTFVQSFKKY